jgi:hypothetical protein
MIGEGETLVELKRTIPAEGLGPTVSSFANTIGGWVILGVDDVSREIVGWKPKGRADDLDYLRDLLANDVDPLPPFAAKPIRLKRRVSAIRVYESSDTPHIVRGTGSVYVRDPGASRKIRSHDELVALAGRGETAGEDARRRLEVQPAVNALLAVPHVRADRQDLVTDVHIIARAAPLTVTPTTRDWPLTRMAAAWCLQRVEQLLPPWGGFGREGPWAEPFGRAVGAQLVQHKPSGARDRAAVVADSAGVLAAQIRRGPMTSEPAFVVIKDLLEDFRLLARFVGAGLAEAEAFGRAVADLSIVVPASARIYGAARDKPPRPLRAVHEIVAPPSEQDVTDLAEAWHREIQREVGIETYEA